MNQPIELAQAHQFVFEQPSQRIELNRVVLAQDFGGGGELNRIGPPGVASEPGLNLLDLPARPLEGTTLVGGADHVLAASRACVCAHSCAAPGYAKSKSRDRRAPSRAGGLTIYRGRKSCLHSGSRPKWPAWRNRRRLSPSAGATFCTAQLLSRETRYRVVEQIDSCPRREPRAACKRSEGHKWV